MSNSPKLKILLVDDHFVVRSGLAASLELEDDIEVIAEVETGEEALVAYVKHGPDVVVMDLQLPGINGIEATARILESDPDARIFIFSTFARDDEIQASLDAGALGYLQKTADRDELLTAIHSVAAGEKFLPGGIAERLGSLSAGPSVTDRERQILERVAKGRANKEIASELGISDDTVKRHISNVLQKFGVSDRAQATAEAIRRGIVRVDS